MRIKRAHLIRVDVFFFARLRGGEQDAATALCLSATSASSSVTLLFEHVEHVMLHAALEPEHDVEVAQTDVGIDQHDARAALRERGAEIGGRRRLADAAFPRGDDDRASEFRGCSRRSCRLLAVSFENVHVVYPAFIAPNNRPKNP